MKPKLLLITILMLSSTGLLHAQSNEQSEPGIYADMKTSKGNILLYLYFVKVPMTVANFVGLAEGKIENNVKPKDVPFFDSSVFHRVIANFMIQGGSAGGQDVSYKFQDEIHPDLKHNRPGILSMANAGPFTNTNQFFITHVATPWLDGRHTVFGHVVKGQDIVNAIAQGDGIISVRIIRIGKEAKEFNAAKTFNALRQK